ncbi:unnamed protein product [Effrenium voratum]|uniref:Uncharacterized protein n=1 Tax=Effrenium voratum TaxID=2562239 RepID=A0AA36NLD5_9DINO|nr:unnamed protein product [Effrenium voratum]
MLWMDKIHKSEAHGTGTTLGDAVELVPLQKRGVLVTAGKTCLGHSEGAAGLAGLARLCAGLGFCLPLVHLRVASVALLAPQEVRTEPAQALGGVSSFGFGGTLAHCVVERFAVKPPPPQPPPLRRGLFRWSARSHPLLDTRHVENGVLFSTPITSRMRRMLDDHVIFGRVIVPAAVFLELALAARMAGASDGAGRSNADFDRLDTVPGIQFLEGASALCMALIPKLYHMETPSSRASSKKEPTIQGLGEPPMAEAADSQASADWVTLCLACDAPLPEGEPRGYEMSCAECGGNDFYRSKSPTKKITAYGTWVFVPHGSAPQEPLGDQQQAPPGAPGGGHSTTSSATTWSIPRASRNAGSRAGHGDPPDEPELGHVREEAESEVPTQDPTHEHHDGDNEHLELENHENLPQVTNQDTVHVLKPPQAQKFHELEICRTSSPFLRTPRVTFDALKLELTDGPERGIRFRSGAPPVPPKWSYSREDVRSFAKFERKVQLWRMQIRAWMPLSEAAMLLYGSLTGEAEDETENLDLEKVNSPGGLDYIMNSLKDGLQSKVVFQKRKLLHDFKSVSRYNNESMRSCTSRHRRTEQAPQSAGIQVSGVYDEEARGSRLLDRAKLTPESQRLVLIGCGYRLDFASISDSLNMSFPEHKQPPPVVGRDGLPYRGGKGRDTSSGHPGGKGQGAGREKGKGNPFTSKGYSGNKGNGKFEKATVYQTDLAEDDEEFDGEDANQFGPWAWRSSAASP